MFDDATRRAIAAYAARHKFEEAALLAVVEVESGGRLYATVAGRQEPLIRWEGHYFDDRLTGEQRAKARALGLAHPSAGRVGNPASQAKRWSQLYLPASRINARAAYESVSWGIGQVMGAHWAWLGYASPAAMLKVLRSGVAGQIEVMVRYIEKAGLVGSLQRLDFAAFARGYNGPAYAKYGYHTKMKRAYERWAGKRASSAASGMLRMGSTGAKVRELQALLVRAGHAVNVDGDFGPATQRALMAFQMTNKLTVDGVAGPETFAALSAYKVAPEEKPGEQGPLQTDEALQGGGGIVGGAGVETASRAIEEAADKTSWVPGLEWLTAILSLIAALLVIGGLCWIAYGWWKSKKTVEAPA
ncbi:N-acetylmuramidase domain-containing protein [Mesorhizobium sp. Z1-4]|uniref:N-acetylmuramidase domain-containing protein n=1 Tax=Mesorhizobium sp. Z1-4 TaxID=2448478 RepID=UPI0013E0976C|nr:N-acetylmuramidase domain-containing protein [Mesorhizobium sp. Z1-4]